MSTTTSSSTSPPSHVPLATLRRQAAIYLITLAETCHERGGYTLDEAVRLAPMVASVDVPGDEALTFVHGLVEKSQRLGKLTLGEAWTAFNAQRLLFGSATNAPECRACPTPTSTSTHESMLSSAGTGGSDEAEEATGCSDGGTGGK